MDDNWSEPDIVRGLQDGDSDAWAALCDQYSERLWMYVARLIGSNEAAVADVFQETLMAVAKGGRSLHDGSRLWAWLSSIGHNQCALYWRQANQRNTDLLVEERALCESADVLELEETVAAVRQLLTELPPDYSQILTAKYTEGLSAAEIAQQSGENLEAVRSRLARARKEFRTRYERLIEATSEVN